MNKAYGFHSRNAGVAGAEDYIADEANVPEAYTDPLGVIENNTALPQSRITIKWKEDAQFEENLERIITQKWIAIFPLGNEAWAEYRRTGYPKLMPAKDNKSGGTGKLQVRHATASLPVRGILREPHKCRSGDNFARRPRQRAARAHGGTANP